MHVNRVSESVLAEAHCRAALPHDLAHSPAQRDLVHEGTLGG